MRYRYDNMGAEAFEQLVNRLVEAEPGQRVLPVVSFTSQPRRLYTDECLRLVNAALDRQRGEIKQRIAKGARHCLVVTNYEYRDMGKSIQDELDRLGADWGLESLHVWWTQHVDTRFETAALATRLEFVNILPADEARIAQELDKRVSLARRTGHLNLADLGLTRLPNEVFEITDLLSLELRANRLTSLPPEIGKFTRLFELGVGDNQLTNLPAELFTLPVLHHLVLSRNKLTELPAELGSLDRLTDLDTSNNQLRHLPPEVGKLVNLQTLRIQNNNLADLPAEFANLTRLNTLELQNNPLHDVPLEVTQLTSLRTLYLQSAGLTKLPAELANLVHLETLGLQNNQITILPSELSDRVAEGLILRLERNPLKEPLPELLERGSEALASYLRSLVGAVEQYEAKVLLVGEGNVGKTSLVIRLHDGPFVENRPTTHGIEIRSLTMRHPSDDIDMTVRTWDFGGQEVYRITHQFFFSHRALYIVVWNARQGQEQDEVDGWLRRIRLRVGAQARTLLVATHCDERRPEIDYPSLRREFPEMLNGQFEIDSRTSTGMATLHSAIAEQVARLPHMGQLLNARWISARNEILGRADAEPQLPHEEFVAICRRHELADDEITTLAELLHDLGQIVYYGDDDGLRDIVVLNPEWLTKAIGYVLEDTPTRDNGGVLNHSRLIDIWQNTPDGYSYPAKFHPFFLRLMEKFDVSYRLDDEQNSSLVAQLVSHDHPELPWDFDTAPARDIRSLAFTCQLSEPAPGLIAWLTVRHHRFTTGKHWRRGVFLRHPITTYASEALIELRSDRELAVEVRAPSPDLFFNVLRDAAEDLLRRRWPGLSYQLTIPCPTRSRNGTPCAGRFPLDGLLRFRESGGIGHTCLQCVKTHDVPRLLTGFSLPSPDLQPALERLEKQVDNVTRGVDRLESYAADAANSLNRVLKAIATEVNDCPRLFTLTQEEAAGWQRFKFGQRQYRLTIWCEHPGEWHAWPTATYRLQQPKEWLIRIGPYASLVFKTLRLVVPIAKDIAGVSMSDAQFQQAKQELELMKTLVDKLPDVDVKKLELEAEKQVTASRLTPAEGEARRALRVLLFAEDHTRSFGGLRRVHAPSGDFLWVCADHYPHYDPGLPTISGARSH